MADEEFLNIYHEREAYVARLRSADIGGLRDEPLNIDLLSEILHRKYSWAEPWEGTDNNENQVAAHLAELLRDMQKLGVTTVRQLMSMIDRWYEEAYEYSARGHRIASGAMQPETVDDRYFLYPPGSDSRAWCDRTGQYFFPIGQLRYILRKEFPKYDETVRRPNTLARS